MSSILYTNSIYKRLEGALGGEERIVVVDHRGRSIQGKEVLAHIDALALGLSRSGVKKGDRVLFLVRPSIEAVLHFFALMRVGAVIILADPEMGQENFLSRIEFSRVRFVLQDSLLQTIERFSFIKPLLRLFHIWFPENLPFDEKNKLTAKKFQTGSFQNETVAEQVIGEDEDMAIVFTSGTVTTPKGVVHTADSFINALDLISKEISISEKDFLYASQFYFVLLGLMVRAKTFLPGTRKFSAAYFVETSSRLNLSSAFLLPFEGELIYKYCQDKKIKIPNSFTTILFGSAPVTQGFLSRFRAVCPSALRVFGVYGATEMLPISMVSMEEKLKYQGEGDLLGYPMQGVEIKIAEDKEIWVRGPQLFKKYLGEEENAAYFYSGDLGILDKEGNIILLGRKKDMIIRKGYNVYPTLFETNISKIEGVTECSLVGVYDDKLEDERIILFIVTDTPTDNFKQKIKSELRNGENSVDQYAYPDEIIFLPQLPRSGRSKKVDKKSLQTIAKKQLWQK